MTDPGSQDSPGEAGAGFPRRSSLRRSAWTAAAALTVLVLAVAISRLPAQTDVSSLVVRGMVGLAVGGMVIVVVRRSFGSFGSGPPVTPDPVDARSTQVVYECAVCRTRVRLEMAATGKPPRHCGEEMVSHLASER